MAVIATFAVEALSKSVNLAASAVSSTAAPAGSVSFDPCAMYGQIGWFVRLSLFIWLGTFLTLVVQGFRKRPAPRLVALANLAALIAPVHHQRWSFMSCLNTVGQIASLTWILVVIAVALHHLLRPKAPHEPLHAR